MDNRFGKNEMEIYNDVVYGIYNDNFERMRLRYLEAVRILIPFHRANFYLADHSGKHLVADPVGVDFPQEALEKYIAEIEKEDPMRWVFLHAKNTVYREKEMFSDESIQVNKCFQDYYQPLDIYHSLQISLAADNRFLGSLSFYRTEAQPDFSDREIYFFELWKNHLAARLLRETKEGKKGQAVMDFAGAAQKYTLTARETQLIKLLGEGFQISEISEELRLSPNTVKKHISNIYKKMGVSNRLELFRLLYPGKPA